MILGERLKEIRGKTSRDDFAQRLGVSRNTIANYENYDRSPDANFLNKVLEEYPDINPAWLLTGKGPKNSLRSQSDNYNGNYGDKGEIIVYEEDLESINQNIDRVLEDCKSVTDPDKLMFLHSILRRLKSRNYYKDEEFRQETIDILIKKLLFESQEKKKDGAGSWVIEKKMDQIMRIAEFVLVPRYNVQASMGGGADIHSELVVDHLAFKKSWLKEMDLKSDNLALITADGDSMYPTIKSGCLMLVDTRHQETIKDGIYVLRWDGALMAKRLQKLLDGAILVKSDNHIYQEIKAEKDQIDMLNIVGKVVWTGSVV